MFLYRLRMEWKEKGKERKGKEESKGKEKRKGDLRVLEGMLIRRL
jgi:hypothetical protein